VLRPGRSSSEQGRFVLERDCECISPVGGEILLLFLQGFRRLSFAGRLIDPASRDGSSVGE
jgi:hypothetical protein